MGQNQNFLQHFCNMKTDFYKRYKAGCSEKYPNYENLPYHNCEQVKSSVTDVFTNYFICSFKWWRFETIMCMQVQLEKLAHNYEHCDHSLGCRFMLFNCWYEPYLRALEYVSFEKHKIWFKTLSALGGVI